MRLSQAVILGYFAASSGGVLILPSEVTGFITHMSSSVSFPQTKKSLREIIGCSYFVHQGFREIEAAVEDKHDENAQARVKS